MSIFEKILFFTVLICGIAVFDCNASSSVTKIAYANYEALGAQVSQMPVFQHIVNNAEKKIFDSFMQLRSTVLCNNFIDNCCRFASNNLANNIGLNISKIAQNSIGKELLCTILTKYAIKYAEAYSHPAPISFESNSDYIGRLQIIQGMTEIDHALQTRCKKSIKQLKANLSAYSFSHLDEHFSSVITCPSECEASRVVYWVKDNDGKLSMKRLPCPPDTSIAHELIHALHCVENPMHLSASCSNVDVIERRILLNKGSQDVCFNAYNGIVVTPVRYLSYFMDIFANDEEYRTMYGIMDDNTYDRLNETAYNSVVNGTPLVRVSHANVFSVFSSIFSESINQMRMPMDRAVVKYHLGIK